MKNKFRIKGKVVDRKSKTVSGIRVKAYDEESVLITGVATDKNGTIDFECENKPKSIKIIRNGKIIATKEVNAIGIVDYVIDWGEWVICFIPHADWHIKGIIKDKMSGDPLENLTIEVWDVDTSISGGPYYDPLGEDVTDAAGEFNVWFDGSIFEREATWMGEINPDVLIKIKNSKGVIIHETAIDNNVIGSPHICLPYCTHKGKEYLIEIDYVTVAINMVGPVDIANINSSGHASHSGITDRPFGGNTTISGIIWGTKVSKWKLYYAQGFVDSNDSRFSGLGPSSPEPTGFSKVSEGATKVWDGPIHKWSTSGLEGTYTVVLVVWDQDGNEYHDTQVLFLHNTAITPAAQISSPTPGSTLSKGTTGDAIEIQGTASDDYFLSFNLHWVGPTQTELTSSNITYPTAGNIVPVLSAKLGEWNINSLPEGPYCLRLAVYDRTILNDGGDIRADWTWNTIIIST